MICFQESDTWETLGRVLNLSVGERAHLSFLELCPAMDHRLGALGLLGSSGGLFCCENCYSAFWDSVGIPGRCLPTQTHQCSSTVIDPSGGDVVY